MKRAILTRRNRKSEGGARATACGLGCGEALITGSAEAARLAGPVPVIALCLALANPAAAELPVLGNAPVQPHDILWEGAGETAAVVLRFLAPQITKDGSGPGFDATAPVMDTLCTDVAIPTLDATGTEGAQIVIVVMDRPIPRGIPMPEATQFINTYTRAGNRCIWEDF